MTCWLYCLLRKLTSGKVLSLLLSFGEDFTDVCRDPDDLRDISSTPPLESTLPLSVALFKELADLCKSTSKVFSACSFFVGYSSTKSPPGSASCVSLSGFLLTSMSSSLVSSFFSSAKTTGSTPNSRCNR